MDVLPNEEEQMLKNGAREFLEAESPPSLAREMERDELGYPPALWKQMGDLGWLGLAIPEEYGGQGATLTYLGIVLEEVGRAISPVPFHSTMVPALTVASDGTEEQRRELLPRLCSGDLVMSWAFTERDARYRPQSVRMEAVEEGDYFLLSGTKTFVDSFQASEKCLVACRTSPASERGEGITLFLVDTGSPGVSDVPLVTLAKDRQSKVTFDRVRVPRSSIVGGLDQGWPVAERMLDRGRPSCAPRWWAPPGRTWRWPWNTPSSGSPSAGR